MVTEANNNWDGEFIFAEACAAYRGPISDHSPHVHAAYQLAIGHIGNIAISDSDGKEILGKTLLVRPNVSHGISARGQVSLIFVEPQSPIAVYLSDTVDPGDIVPVNREHVDAFVEFSDFHLSLKTFIERCGVKSRDLDPRLLSAIDLLTVEPGTIPISTAAKHAGLSESRLRALASKQLSTPLSTHIIWRKLEQACQELAKGVGLAEAALAGGFADQAHFSRTMRRMFGVTPTQIAPMMRTSANRFVQETRN